MRRMGDSIPRHRRPFLALKLALPPLDAHFKGDGPQLNLGASWEWADRTLYD
jgi:hypothetical protein